MGAVVDFADFWPISESEVGARNGQERVECGPERPIQAAGEVRRRSQEPASVRGNRRDQTRKNPNRERLGFCYWWWNTELNPRPLSEPDSNTLALRAWIRRFGHRHCSESKSNSSQSLPDQRKPSSSGMADVPFGRIEKCRLFPVVLSDQVAWQVPHWQ